MHCSNLFHNEWSGELAELLVKATIQHGGMGFPEGDPSSSKSVSYDNESTSGLKVFFTSSCFSSAVYLTANIKHGETDSGTESNEGAIKFARKYGKSTPAKHEFVCFHDGFHGRSMGALSATMQEKYQLPYAPLIPGFKGGKLNDVEAVQELVNENTCGVIVEPIQVCPLRAPFCNRFGVDAETTQGEGGIMEAHEPFLRALRKRCDEVGAALIFDEIQVSPDSLQLRFSLTSAFSAD